MESTKNPSLEQETRLANATETPIFEFITKAEIDKLKKPKVQRCKAQRWETHRRRNIAMHSQVEMRRRNRISTGIAALRLELPDDQQVSHRRMTKTEIVDKSLDYIKTLNEENSRLVEEALYRFHQ
ncbi:hypothetical protein ACOME3_006424 [Neoechinorhynchus agilis]